ncbi:MAG: hypothetical protein JW723_08955 [Bacteroidales bacterium]|nr:hypothetical protein [Bacteroidales bacterium]
MNRNLFVIATFICLILVISGSVGTSARDNRPGRTGENTGQDNYATRRSSIQVAELGLVNGQITCNRDKPVYIRLELPE